MKKIYESNFSILNLEECYNDIVQILNKLKSEREENYSLGCLNIISMIVEYYHQKLGIDL